MRLLPPTRRFRGVATGDAPVLRWFVATVVLAGAMLLAGGGEVLAQETDCEEVSYNERIVTKCSSTTGSGDGPPTSSTPGLDADDGDDESLPGRAGERRDRGDRGSRYGADLDDEYVEADPDDSSADESSADAAEPADAADPDESESSDSDDEATGAVVAAPDDATGAFEAQTEPSPNADNLPIVGALAAFTVLGGGFTLAARRARGDTVG